MTHALNANRSKHLAIRPLLAWSAKAIRSVLLSGGQLIVTWGRNTLAALCVVCRSFEMAYVDPYAQTKRNHDQTDRTRF